MDDYEYPSPDLNVLGTFELLPYPNWLYYTVYQTLVTANYTTLYNQGTVQYLPMLAQNWTVSADGTTYAFNLRQNVTFSDGNPVNSYQIWAWEWGEYYLSGNSSNWIEAYPLFNISAVNFGPATVQFLNNSGGLVNPNSQAIALMSNSSWPIYVNGPDQIVFRMEYPFQWLLGLLVGYSGYVPDMQWVLDNGGLGTPAAYNSNFANSPIPGTGPYVVTGVSPNSYVSFTQNSHYWGDNLSASQIAGDEYLDPGHVKNVVIYAKTDDTTRYVDLSTGAAQIAEILTQNWNLIQASPDKYGYVKLPQWSGGTFAFSLNTQLYPTNITAVRQAIVHAINYSDIYAKVFHGLIYPWVGPEYQEWKQFYDLGNYTPYQYNLTLAKQDLTNAGINVSNLPTMVFRVPTTCPYCLTSAELVQSYLAQLGMTLNINVLPPAQIFSAWGTYSYMVANANLSGNINVADYLWISPLAQTPADYWEFLVSNTSIGLNYAIYYNPTVQLCSNDIVTSSNATLLKNVCSAAQTQIYNDAPYAWVGSLGTWTPGGSIVYDKSTISGFLTDPLWASGSTLPEFNTVTFVGS
jgi:peptide/nickel transport system substrate-binding protein